MKKPGRQFPKNMKRIFFCLIIFPAVFLLCANIVHASKGIAASLEHSVALKEDGTVWAWGYNYAGQLGDGTTIERHMPVLVSGLSNVEAIAAGASHTVALKNDGTLWAWGSNDKGQLGDGSTANSSTPVQILSGVTAIAAGYDHTVALKEDGTVWAWGLNENGQLGDGTQTDSSTPVRVSGLSNVTAIAAGGGHSVALKQDGTVWAWGLNSNGQLGDGTTTDRLTPVQVSGLSTNVTAIAAAAWNTFTRKLDGTVWAWGWNGFGELGNGMTTNSSTPVQAIGSNVTAVAPGSYHTVGLKHDGTVWAVGRDFAGQLGDGTTTDSLTPVFSNIVLFPCTYFFSPYNYGYGDLGGSGSVNLTVYGSSCLWTAASPDPWISVTSGSSGIGNGTVAFNVSPNITGSARTGKISIGNQDIFILQAQSTFLDDPNDMFTPYIYAIATEGITRGCWGDPNYYCPGDVVTRGAMAAFVIRAIHGEYFNYTQTPYFADVPVSNGYFKYVQKMRDDGITLGCWGDTNHYCPDDVVTRGAMAAFIIRAKYGEDFDYTQTPYFADVPASNGYFKYVQKMKDEGITGNVGTYNWTDLVIREHMAAFLSRAFLEMRVVPSPFQGSLQGTYSGNCSIGTFSITIDANGNVTGSYTEAESPTPVSVRGTVNISGNFSAWGLAGDAYWTGTFALVQGSLTGSGSWNVSGTSCAGTWSGP